MHRPHRIMVAGAGLEAFFAASDEEKNQRAMPRFKQILSEWEELGARVVASMCDEVFQVGPTESPRWAWYLLFDVDDLDIAAAMIQATRQQVDGVRGDSYFRFELRMRAAVLRPRRSKRLDLVASRSAETIWRGRGRVGDRRHVDLGPDLVSPLWRPARFGSRELIGASLRRCRRGRCARRSGAASVHACFGEMPGSVTLVDREENCRAGGSGKDRAGEQPIGSMTQVFGPV
jgi:hypothetical protein